MSGLIQNNTLKTGTFHNVGLHMYFTRSTLIRCGFPQKLNPAENFQLSSWKLSWSAFFYLLLLTVILLGLSLCVTIILRTKCFVSFFLYDHSRGCCFESPQNKSSSLQVRFIPGPAVNCRCNEVYSALALRFSFILDLIDAFWEK